MSNGELSGLPPIARSRIERAKSAGVATSLLDVAGQAGIDACGFVPVGEVMGCVVTHLGFQGYGGCGWMPGYGYAPTNTVTSRAGSAWGFGPYVEAVQGAWDTALDRLLAECRGLGGDGVIGVTFAERSLGEGNREYVVLGTAVRSLGVTHLRRPFTTTLPGQDFAKLLHNCWAPTSVLVAISVGVRHDDWMTQQAAMAYGYNVEVSGYTDLVETVRSDVRRIFAARAATSGASGAIVSAPMELFISEMEMGEGHRDHLAQATLIGTGIVAVPGETPQGAQALAVMPLRSTRRRAGRAAAGGVRSGQIEQGAD